MIEKEPGAIVLSATGEHYDKPCRIMGILWVGPTTSGDSVMIKGQGTSQNRILWPAQTDVSNTYLGFSWNRPGLHAPQGFRAETITSGAVYVYIAEI